MEVGPRPKRDDSRWRGLLASLAGVVGLALLVVGIFVGLFASAWKSPWIILMLVIGAGGLVVGFVFNTRRGLAGLSVAVQCILALALLVMASFANTRYYHRFDLTSEKQFELSSYTKSVLSHLEKPVAITTFFPVRSASGHEMMATWPRVKDLLEEYKLHAGKIQVEGNVDPFVDRESMELLAKKLKMKLADMDPGSVVFHCGEKRKHVPYRELMEYPSPYARGEPPRFKGEEAFTAAILSVTEEKQTTLYFLTGHGERGIDRDLSVLVRALKQENYRVLELSLGKGMGVPDDCDALAIIGPTSELPPDEVAEVESYVDAGGRLLLLLDFMQPQERLIGMVAKWGIEVGDDVVIDPGRYNQVAFRPVVNEYPHHQITKPMKGIDTLFLLARSVSPETDQPGGAFRALCLVETSDQSWAESDLDNLMKGESARYDEGADKKGPISLAVVAEAGPSPYGPMPAPGGGGKVVVFGDSDFVTDKSIVDPLFGVVSVPGNLDLFSNTVRWLAGKEHALGISPKTIQSRMLTLTDRGKRYIFWTTVVGMPAFVLIVGGIMWFWRRRS